MTVSTPTSNAIYLNIAQGLLNVMKTTPLPLPNVSSSSSVPVYSAGMGADLKKELSNPHIGGVILELADIKSPQVLCSCSALWCI